MIITQFLKSKVSLFALLMMIFAVSCNNDDEMDPTTGDVVASFQFDISDDNFLEVSFTNFSQNATSYSWNFGDGNNSSDESPTHVYAEAGAYTIALTATGSDGTTASKSESITLSDPDAALALLAGTTSKDWYLLRDGIALGIGEAIDVNAWWSFGEGGVTPIADRPCIVDDVYTFHRDGTWEGNTMGTLFIDSDGNGGWLDPMEPEGCRDETEAGIFDGTSGDQSAYANGGNYTYDYDVASGTITLLGEGVYIGLPQKGNNADDDAVPAASKLYTVFNISEGDIADTLNIALVRPDNSAWNFYLASYHDINDLPDIPVLLPNADFSFESTDFSVDFTNNSNAAAINFAWDFGDGNNSTEENPTNVYAAAGDYDVKLDTDDGAGNSATVTKTVSVGVVLPAPTSMGHTFVDAAGADLLSQFQGASTIDLGVDDPADASAAKVGQFNRTVDVAFQEAIMSFDPPTDIDFANLSTVSIDVYVPSTNDYTMGLNKNVIVGLGDFLVNSSGNWWEDHAEYATVIDDTQLDSWVTLTYDVTMPNSGANMTSPKDRSDLDMVYINIGGGGHGTGATFYVRNLSFQ